MKVKEIIEVWHCLNCERVAYRYKGEGRPKVTCKCGHKMVCIHREEATAEDGGSDGGASGQ